MAETWTEKIQRRLATLGFDPGPVDGELGPRTRAAIHACQDWHNFVAGSDNVDQLLWPEGQILSRDKPTTKQSGEAAVPRPDVWPIEANVPEFYGEMGENLARLELPFKMRLAWDRDTWIDGFSVHEKVHDSAARCFARIADAYPPALREKTGIDVFSGCLSAPRPKRGGSSWSMHSWGIAIDFDNTRNRLHWNRQRARLAQPDCEEFWRIWEEEGWVSLGRARNFDWMHVQAARL